MAFEKTWAWHDYYAAVRGRPPRDTLVKALELFEPEPPLTETRLAADLGCGAGVDTLALLDRGWRVLAIDNNAEGLRQLELAADTRVRPTLETRCEPLESLRLPSVDLVNASYSLPFCSPEHFDSMWSVIVSSIRPGGRFAGQLFGPADTWAIAGKVSYQTEEQVRGLFSDFDIEYFHIRDEEGTTALGDKKHWHVFSVVARRM